MPTALRACVTGLGMAVPAGVMTNDDFAKFLDTNDEWITQRTGIKKRRIVGEGESTASLSTEAARLALADAGLEAGQLDLILVATISPEMIFPATACFVQANLGVTGIPAFDISAACSGFVYALTVGAKFIESGMYRRVMVIGAETLSRFSDYTDRGSCILFGDGAGAAVLEATEDLSKGVQYSCLFADGAGWDFIHVPAGGSRQIASAETVAQRLHYIKMKGRDVYKFAVDKMQWLLEDCMKACNLSVDDVDLVVPHQVNSRIIESATQKLSFPPEKVYVNIDKYGNTSAASIPMAMVEARQEGKIKPGSTVVMVAFGAGLTWAGAVVRM
ncbi:MAG: ketoacyl-ACP synthase III [Phycisphaerae bacterium]|nr:ketoacyl-ACP synthase III [Phycisphaerae bacterium]